jgi:C-8 sterol isomerase
VGVALVVGFLYFATKNYLFERVLQKHFVFDPLVLRKLIKKAIDDVPEDTNFSPNDAKLNPVAIEFKPDGWYKLPNSDGRPVLERHEKVLEDRCAGIIRELAKHYGKKHIHGSEHDFLNAVHNEEKWLYVIVGSAVGQMIMLHTSLTEYIIIFGTPMGTSGHSGRYTMDVFDYIVHGKHHTYAAGDLHVTEHLPGEMTVLPRGEAVVYKSTAHTYMVEYGRGFPGVLLAIFYPILATLFQTLDFYTVCSFPKLLTI